MDYDVDKLKETVEKLFSDIKSLCDARNKVYADSLSRVFRKMKADNIADDIDKKGLPSYVVISSKYEKVKPYLEKYCDVIINDLVIDSLFMCWEDKIEPCIRMA